MSFKADKAFYRRWCNAGLFRVEIKPGKTRSFEEIRLQWYANFFKQYKRSSVIWSY